MHKKMFFVTEFLLLLLLFFIGRSFGFYEILSNRPSPYIVSEVNQGIAVLTIEEGDCEGVKGKVTGQEVRLFYHDELVIFDNDGIWHIAWNE